MDSVEFDDPIESKPYRLAAFQELPVHFVQFLKDNGIPSDAYDLDKVYRYLRVNEKKCNGMKIEDIASSLSSQISKALEYENGNPKLTTEIQVEILDWFASSGHRFLRLDASYKIAATEFYKKGYIYGIDLSSAAAVLALNLKSSDHVLDFCCAPGAKLSMISDEIILREIETNILTQGEYYEGSISGVDISASRLASCRTLVQKYQLSNVRLFLDDACTFNCLAPTNTKSGTAGKPPLNELISLPPVEFPQELHEVSVPQELSTVPNLPRRTSKKMKKQGQRMETLFFSSNYQIASSASQSYDKIIVDAQCTLDASIRHLLKQHKVGWIEFEGNPSQVISNLQKKMIFNAFRLLKPGGTLVYSTCSFCNLQNEDVIRWLLKVEPEVAQVQEIDWPQPCPVSISQGNLPGTVRFYPKDTGTSGMFIAKLTKLKKNP